MKNIIYCFSLLICASLLVNFSMGNGIVLPSVAKEAQFLYFISDLTGKFIKVDLETQQVVEHGTIAQDERTQKMLPPFIRDAVLIHQALYDASTEWLYLLAQKDVGLTRGSTLRTQVLVLRLPTFEFVGALHEDAPVTAGANLFLSQDGKRLLLTYVKRESDERSILISELYDTATLELIKSQKTEIPENWHKVDQLSGSYLGLDLTTIYEGRFKHKEGCGKNYRKGGYVPPEVERFVKQHPSSFFNKIFLNGKIILWESKTRQHVRHYPVEKGGKKQEIEEKYKVKYSTGWFLVYDQFGQKLFELTSPELAGEYPQVITVTPDGRTLYFAIGGKRLYAIDLTKKKPPVRIDTHGIDARFTICIFADR